MLIAFYFLTSFVFLNRVFVETSITIPGTNRSHFALNGYEPHFYKMVKDYYKQNTLYDLEDVIVLPLFKDDTTYFTIKASVSPKKKFHLIDNAADVTTLSQQLFEQTVRDNQTTTSEFKTIVTSNHNYFYENKMRGLIKLAFYSLLFSLVSLAVIFLKSLMIRLKLNTIKN